MSPIGLLHTCVFIPTSLCVCVCVCAQFLSNQAPLFSSTQPHLSKGQRLFSLHGYLTHTHTHAHTHTHTDNKGVFAEQVYLLTCSLNLPSWKHPKSTHTVYLNTHPHTRLKDLWWIISNDSRWPSLPRVQYLLSVCMCVWQYLLSVCVCVCVCVCACDSSSENLTC